MIIYNSEKSTLKLLFLTTLFGRIWWFTSFSAFNCISKCVSRVFKQSVLCIGVYSALNTHIQSTWKTSLTQVLLKIDFMQLSAVFKNRVFVEIVKKIAKVIVAKNKRRQYKSRNVSIAKCKKFYSREFIIYYN